MKRFIVPTICAAAILCPTLSAAQGKGNGPKPKATTGVSAHGGGAARGGSKTHVTSHGVQGGAKAHSGTTSARGGGHVKTTAKTAKGPHVKNTANTTKGPKSASTTTATASTTTAKRTSTATAASATGTALTPVQQKLQKNTNLANKLQSRLPAGTDLTTAAAGFKNLGQFVAAVNVSNNLGLDFTTLKTALVENGMSLGQAIQSQKQSVDGTTEARLAQTQADALIQSTETSTGKTAGKTRTAGDDRR